MKQLRLSKLGKEIPLSKLRIEPLLFAFLLPFLGMSTAMYVGGFYPFGKAMILYSDMYYQYFPFFVQLRDNILSGDGFMWTWSVGMGLDYLGLFAYYLASPLNLLSIFLPESMLLGYFSMLLPIKLGLAGLFFALFLKKVFNRNDWSIVLFGALYATCAWALAYQWNIMWLDTFALLPVVVIGMLSLLEKRKFMLYTLSLFLAVYVNYYIGFFICIFVFLTFICYEICRFESIKKTLIDLSLMAVFSLLALGMTLILELPAYAALQNTYASENKFPADFALNLVKENNFKGLLEAMTKIAGNMNGGIKHNFVAYDGLPNIYCGVGTIMLAFLLLTTKEVKLREKICFLCLLIFLMLSFAIKQLDYIWHGFHFPVQIPYRFSFIFSFVLLVMAYRAFTLWDKFKVWQVIVSVFFCLIIVFLPEKQSSAYLTLNLILLSLYALVCIYQAIPVYTTKKMKKEQIRRLESDRKKLCSRTLAGILAVELILNLVNYGIGFYSVSSRSPVSGYPKGKDDAKSAIAYMKELEKDTLFYRAEATHNQALNDSALNGYNGISTFTSSAYVNVTEFMQALGFAAYNSYNRYCYEESSPVANLFLNLKYMIERDGDTDENSYFDEVARYGKVILLENNAYLPLGFLANSELGDLKFPINGNHFQFQDNLIKASTGISGIWSTVSSSNIQITSNADVTLTSVDKSGVCNYNATGNGNVTFTFYPQEEGFFCIDIDQSKRNDFYFKKNGKMILSVWEGYSLTQLTGISDVAPGDKIEIIFRCKPGESGKITLKNGILNESLFRQAYDILNASTLNLTEFSTTKVAGTIDCNRDGLLYTSIPQTGNWQASVDGQVVETVKIGDAMLGIPLTEGEHIITITYHNKAFVLGAAITAVSATALIALWVIFYKPYKRFLKEQ